ncbi:hypothetical protein Hamer_G020486 [Homarus americanus]|uniref:C-type lectin domain-containing protein n=1 Tax=Homarus americanus TaxID=6706 RepID=A0A8J5MK47_HOMAM|nr:hypothetical protein Hamer_G020486 [Homarus americanus]
MKTCGVALLVVVLAIMVSAEEESNKSYWLGGTDFFEEDNWFWLNKKKVLTGAPFWEPGQPDGGLKENNLIINHHGHLEDRDPSELHPFICQLK